MTKASGAARPTELGIFISLDEGAELVCPSCGWALEKRACGYRSRARFREAILFHCGGLDLYPRRARAHTKS